MDNSESVQTDVAILIAVVVVLCVLCVVLCYAMLYFVFPNQILQIPETRVENLH